MLNIRRYQWWINKKKPNIKRIVLSASIFVFACTSLVFHAPLYNSDVSVGFEVFNKDGKSYCQYPKEDTLKIKKFKKKYTFLAGVVGFTNAGRQASFKQTDYTYTGLSEWIDDGLVAGKQNFRIRFKTSGTLTLKRNLKIDVWMCGGGAGGGSTGNGTTCGGGGGGRTGQWNSIELISGVAYSIAIGAGGSPSADGGATGIAGGSLNVYVSGGNTPNPRYYGGHGGSGAGGGCANGGANGGGGASGLEGPGGNGQGFSTYEFSNSSLTLYCGGGGGGAGGNNWDPNFGWGGAGGGARGGDHFGGTGWSAAANTGGGGGGGGARGDSGAGGTGGWGGSGILVIRNQR